MTYTITTLATLAESMLRPLLASLSVRITSESTDHGFATIAIECDEATAAAIEAAGFEVAER
jgi:lipoate-protein ligase B